MLGKIKYHDGNISQITEIPEHIRAKHKEVFEINPRWLIKSAAYRGKWIDQSQSLNIYFQGTSGKELSEVYTYAWEMGLKTTYYLRTLGASQVEKATVDTAKYGSTHLRKNPVAAPSVVSETTAAPTAMELPKSEPIPVKMKASDLPDLSTVKACLINDPTCEACQA
jgi:ribonucleoside-diphosphate reductase alpha chain